MNGDFVAGLQATRTLALEKTAAPGLEPLERQGTHRGPPEMRANVYLDRDWRNWQAGGGTGYCLMESESSPDKGRVALVSREARTSI